MATDDQVLAIGSLNDVDDVGHADNSFVVVEHGLVADLEVLSLADCLVDWVPLEHEGQLDPHVEGDHIVDLLLTI